jgi:ATP-dependent helicase/DNAse subunit B
MGLSEGEFPAVISEDPFLRDADRAALRRECQLKLEPSTQSAEREFFYEAVARPSERLLLTRPTLADNGAAWPPSPFWEAVHQAIGSPTLPPPVSGESLIPIGSAASWAEYWQSLAEMAFPEAQPFEAETWARIQRAAEILQSREQAAATDFDGFLPQLAGQLGSDFGPEHTWSASRLETYQRCGYFFFIQNVLFLEARPEPAEGLDVTQLGSVYHHIFEAVYNAGLPDNLDQETVREFVTTVATPILDAAPQKEGFRETPWWSQTKQEMIGNVAASILALQEGGFRFFQSEAAFGFDELPYLVIDTAAGRLQLRGFIDRIDRDENGRLRIIDYKLGGPGQFSKRAFEEGKKLQLPLYALAAQQTLGLGPVAEGFYWHFNQGKASYFTLSKAEGAVNGAVETAVNHAAHAVELIRHGRFTPKAPEGGCPAYCPAAAFCWHYTPPSFSL